MLTFFSERQPNFRHYDVTSLLLHCHVMGMQDIYFFHGFLSWANSISQKAICKNILYTIHVLCWSRSLGYLSINHPYLSTMDWGNSLVWGKSLWGHGHNSVNMLRTKQTWLLLDILALNVANQMQWLSSFNLRNWKCFLSNLNVAFIILPVSLWSSIFWILTIGHLFVILVTLIYEQKVSQVRYEADRDLGKHWTLLECARSQL